jgi:hypothetical protein
MNRQLSAMQDRLRRGVEERTQVRGGLRFGRVTIVLNDRVRSDRSLRNQHQRNQPQSEFCHVRLTTSQTAGNRNGCRNGYGYSTRIPLTKGYRVTARIWQPPYGLPIVWRVWRRRYQHGTYPKCGISASMQVSMTGVPTEYST